MAQAEKFEKCCKYKIELKGTKATRTVYEYDSGDGWEHGITRMSDIDERSFECLRTTGLDGKENCGGC